MRMNYSRHTDTHLRHRLRFLLATSILGCASAITIRAANCPPIIFGPVPIPTMTVPTIGFQSPNTVVTVDVNHDQKLDLVYCGGQTVVNVLVALGDGNGGFRPASNVISGYLGTSIAVADLNRDTHPDIVVVGTSAPVPNVRVALGNGNGTFKAPVQYPATTTSAQPQFVTIADFDGDGFLDIAVILAFGNSVTYLPGRGDGTFNAARPPTTITSPQGGLVAADFNNDGFVDLATTLAGTQIGVLINQGDGTFLPSTNTPVNITGVSMTSLRVADLNGDGVPDLTAISIGTTKQFLAFLGVGNGTFTLSDQKPISTAALYNLTIADLTGDGRPDAAVAANTAMALMENLGNGKFADALLFPVSSAGSATSGDYNKDGKSDIVIFGGDPAIRIFLNETEFLPAKPVLTWRFTTGPVRLVWYTNYGGYALQYSPQLGSGATWQPPTGSPTVVNCQYFFNVTANGPGYYRLTKP